MQIVIVVCVLIAAVIAKLQADTRTHAVAIALRQSLID